MSGWKADYDQESDVLHIFKHPIEEAIAVPLDLMVLSLSLETKELVGITFESTKGLAREANLVLNSLLEQQKQDIREEENHQ